MTHHSRRSFFCAGLGALVAAASSPARLAWAERGPGSAPAPSPKLGRSPARRCVVLYMQGGASQIDTFDPKPGRPTGGEFRAIESSVSGLRVSEHLPELAARMHQLSLVRTLSYREGNHQRARYLMHTGFIPQGGVVHPGFGAHLARASAAVDGAPPALPPAVSLNGPGQAPGYLGASWSAFTVPDARAEVRNLAPPTAIPDARVARRAQTWRALETHFAADHHSAQVAGARALGERAITMSAAPELAAFDLSRESAASRARYGADDSRFGAGCLMARRLLESGVDFVEVGMNGWDTHEDNFSQVRGLSAQLDRAAAALIDDLVASGLWSETVLVWAGDFGRSPTINARGGRDHFPAISSVLLGGGPIRAGQVVGETDPEGREILDRQVSVPDLFATLSAALGVEADEVHISAGGRPVTTVDEAGTAITELL